MSRLNCAKCGEPTSRACHSCVTALYIETKDKLGAAQARAEKAESTVSRLSDELKSVLDLVSSLHMDLRVARGLPACPEECCNEVRTKWEWLSAIARAAGVPPTSILAASDLSPGPTDANGSPA